MESRIITSKELTNFIKAIIDSGVETYGVQDKDGIHGKFHYDELSNANLLRLNYDVTLTPPKKYFSPETETLFNYKMAPEIKVSTVFETNSRVIVGVHPYDMIAINQMDEVWKDKNEDSHYFKRRNNTVIIGVDPQKATTWSFWHLMNAKSVEKGFDIWLTKLDENYFVEIATDAGKKLVDKFAKTKKTDEKDIHKRDHIRSNIHKVCSSERKTKAKAGEVPLLIKNNWDHPVWEDLAKKCYSCGSCNIVCPTCYCFDVKDDIEINLKDGTRMRKWDGCQLENFALVGSGENFREKRVDRFKHRLYRKTVYQYEKYNQLACVGCGRCSSVCLPNIADPVAIINKIKEGK